MVHTVHCCAQDVVYKDIIEPLESVSVNMVPTDKDDITLFGSPEEACLWPTVHFVVNIRVQSTTQCARRAAPIYKRQCVEMLGQRASCRISASVLESYGCHCRAM